jgi:methionyl aminopeptidase
MYTKIKTDQEIEDIRESGRMTAEILRLLKQKVEPGATTQDMADIAFREIRAFGTEAAFLGYQGFPSVICISVNDEIVHGIPGPRVIEKGDLVSFDFGVKHNGMITDSAVTVEVGAKTEEMQRLLAGTEESLMAGIRAVKGPTRVGDIAAAVQEVLERYGYGIVRDMVGHGVGHMVHEDPNIPNYGRAGSGELLSPGMTIAIEPMSTIGDYHVKTDADGWTIRTQDGSLSAHFEHTVLITETGYEIITQ